MFNADIAIPIISILFIIGLLWLHAYRSGYKAGEKNGKNYKNVDSEIQAKTLEQES